MAITINGVLCQEIAHGYSENVEITRGPYARKGFFVPNWSDRFRVAIGLLGLANTTSIGGAITLQYPAQHPELTTTFAHSVDFQGVGPPYQGTYQLAYPSVIVWCNYQTMPWTFTPFQQIDPNHPFVFAEQRLSSSCEWIQLPGYACKWSGTGFDLQSEASIRLVLVEMQITIRNLPYMPTAEAYAYSGLINNATYLGVATRQLMYSGTDTQSGAASDGSFQQEATYKFTARSVPWDAQYNPDPGSGGHKFDQVLDKATGNPIIAAVDFTKIIPEAYQY